MLSCKQSGAPSPPQAASVLVTRAQLCTLVATLHRCTATTADGTCRPDRTLSPQPSGLSSLDGCLDVSPRHIGSICPDTNLHSPGRVRSPTISESAGNTTRAVTGREQGPPAPLVSSPPSLMVSSLTVDSHAVPTKSTPRLTGTCTADGDAGPAAPPYNRYGVHTKAFQSQFWG